MPPPPPLIPSSLSTIHSAYPSQATSMNAAPRHAAASRLPRPTAVQHENMYESISSRKSSQPHIYEIIDNNNKPKVPPRTTTATTRNRGKPNLEWSSPMVMHAQSSNHHHYIQQQQHHHQGLLSNVENFNTPHVLQPNVLKYFQQKLYESFGNDPQPQRTILEAVCGSNAAGVNAANGETCINGKNRIDVMLETAQFLATAAYLER